MCSRPSGDALQLLRLMRDTPAHEGDGVSEQRYKAVLTVIADGRTVTEVARHSGVSTRTMHPGLARYENHRPETTQDMQEPRGAGSHEEARTRGRDNLLGPIVGGWGPRAAISGAFFAMP